MQERAELARCIEALCGKIAPAFFFEDSAVELIVPENIERLSLGVIICASQSDQGRLTGDGLDHFLDEPSPGTHPNQFTQPRGTFG